MDKSEIDLLEEEALRKIEVFKEGITLFEEAIKLIQEELRKMDAP